MKAYLSLGLSLILLGCGDATRHTQGESEPESPHVDAGRRRADAAIETSEGTSGDSAGGSGTSATRDASRPRLADAGQPVSSGSEDDCSSAARLVYVVDESGKLSSFRPDLLQFDDIGQLECDRASMPFSMSVDRDGMAWVGYNSGQLYRVSTSDASCTPSARTPGAGGFSIFGMGFVALDGDPDRDQLFIAGNRALDLSFDFQTALGTIDSAGLVTTRVGPLDGAIPELTGTGDGKLWAFYAQDTPPRLNRLDPASGATLETHTLGSIGGGGSTAWAIAFWGGDFWLFMRATGAPSTTVYRVDGKTFEQRAVLPATGRGIVGAGVSTCAPLVLI
jgi:hypothetical protein